MTPNNSEKTSPLRELTELGQSVWLDFIRRSLLESGELERLVRHDDVRGLTSNPAIFEKAISAGDEYSAQILEVTPRAGGTAGRSSRRWRSGTCAAPRMS